MKFYRFKKAGGNYPKGFVMCLSYHEYIDTIKKLAKDLYGEKITSENFIDAADHLEEYDVLIDEGFKNVH